MSAFGPAITSSAFGSAIQSNAFGGAVSRYFLTYGGVNEQSSWSGSTITGDVTIPFTFINRGGAGIRTIIGNSADILSRVYCEGSNLKAALAGSVAHDFGAVPLNTLLDGVLVRSGTDWTVTIDGVAQGGAYTAAGNVVLDLVGNSFGGFFFDDVIADIGIDAPTDAIDIFWPIDTSSITTAVNQRNPGTNDLTHTQVASGDIELMTQVGNDWLGSELVVNGGFDTDTDWVKGGLWTISGGLATSVNTAGFDIRQDPVLTIGITYKGTNDTVSPISGTLRMLDGGSGIVADISPAGSNEFIYTAAGTRVNFTCGSGGYIGSLDNVSVKRILQGA